MKNKKESGFTLIELLVVLAIIGILAALILSNLATARAKARDAKRKSDIHALENAMEMYADDHGYVYPTPYDDYTQAVPIQTALKGLDQKYIKTLPQDAVSGKYYHYSAAPGGADYALFGALEAANAGEWFCASAAGSGIITPGIATPANYATCVPVK